MYNIEQQTRVVIAVRMYIYTVHEAQLSQRNRAMLRIIAA